MLSVEDITYAYGDVPVLQGVELKVRAGEILCLLGASGSGKTTLLRIIAGLERGYRGHVFVDGQSVDQVPPHRRGFGLMFQDFALFPHMRVDDNVAFGLRMVGMPAEQRRQRVNELLELVGLRGFAERDVTQLSGGEKQRVALARSLAPRPNLIMFDEPLGSLDAGLRDRLARDLRHIIRELGLTVIYVTHDQQEAYTLADRIAVMQAGRIAQVDTPSALYRRPGTVSIARFLGLTNIVPVQRVEAGRASTPLGEFAVQGQPAALLLHPDGIYSHSEGFNAQVGDIVFQGRHYRIQARATDTLTLLYYVDTYDQNQVAPQVGDAIRLAVDPSAIIELSK